MPTKRIDPVNRIEGHMAVEVDSIGAGGWTTPPAVPTPDVVTDARVQGTMYRGLENVMAGREPGDAIQIMQRI